MSHPVEPFDVADLAAFLSHRSRAEGTLTYRELQGFLFCVAAAPDLVPPSEWLPQIFAGEDPAGEMGEHAEAVTRSIFRLLDRIKAQMEGGRPELPQECAFVEEPLANLEDDAPVAHWSRGFLRGHVWLRKSWDPFVPEHLEEEMAAVLLVLGFFSSRPLAEAAAAGAGPSGASLEALADMARRTFPDAMASYHDFGRSVLDAWIRVATEPQAVTGRSLGPDAAEPCPCGSGDAYEACCGGA